MEEEIWRDIPGYEGLYQASDFGRVRSIVENMNRRKRVLSACKTIWGYYQVRLTDDEHICRHESVHKLVCLAFHPIPEEWRHLLGTRYLQVNHKDEDKTNNRADNLEWVTPSYNSGYGTITERRLKTHKERRTCVAEAGVRQIAPGGDIIRVWNSLAEIERETGFSKAYICWCCKGKYKHAYGYKWEYDDWHSGAEFARKTLTTDPQQCGSD